MEINRYGLYVHIPYCKSKCRYCDFYTSTAQGVPEEYIDAVVREFKRLSPKNEEGAPVQPITVYFGGGTPGLMKPEQVKRLLDVFQPAAFAEITLEANPEKQVLDKLEGWHKAGVNRISFGVQTAKEESLRRLGRLHSPQDAVAAIQKAKEVGFENISGDIMLALPEYSEKEFDDTLALLQDNGVTHISAYILKIEEGTAFYRNRPAGIPDDERATEYYTYACKRLEEEGFLQYEISNFAKIGFEGKHNLLYWDCEDYLGIGPSAHSCMRGERFSFPPNNKDFLHEKGRVQAEGILDANDYIMLRLRLTEGLQEEKLLKRYGISLTNRQINFLENLQKAGLARGEGNTWRLTAEGFLVQNSILTQLLD